MVNTLIAVLGVAVVLGLISIGIALVVAPATVREWVEHWFNNPAPAVSHTDEYPTPTEVVPESTAPIEIGEPGTWSHLVSWMWDISDLRGGRTPKGGWRAYVREQYSPIFGVPKYRGDGLLSELADLGLLLRVEREPTGTTYELPGDVPPRFRRSNTSPYGDPRITRTNDLGGVKSF